jgi:hypothetical protein
MRPVLAGVLLLQVLFAQRKAPAPQGLRPWPDYPVILWSTGNPRTPILWPKRISEAGFTGEACPASDSCKPSTDPPLSFYIDNMVSELAFHHARESIYDTDWKAYVGSGGDKQYLIRKPCFDDPAFWTEITKRLEPLIRAQRALRPLAYNLRDEPSIGKFTSPTDYCFCPHTLRAFREWLKTRYASIQALNAEWETAFAGWEEVVPMTTFEIKRREKAALAAKRPENYAPWADHREFMDQSFAGAIGRLRSMIHRIDEQTPVGLTGLQMPSAWGGSDLWKLSRVVDWVEPYDIAGSRAILQSVLPRGVPVLTTYFGSDQRQLRSEAWSRLLGGDRGAIVWDDEQERVIEKSSPDLPITARGNSLRSLFQEIRATAPQIRALTPVDDRIAIHYSQASIRAQWMFDSREDGGTWPRRLSSYEETHSRAIAVRESFIKVVEDLGLTANFVAYEQIENDELLRGHYKVLLLPESVAMSALECSRIVAFVQAGGVVIADNMAATMDEHGRRLPQGQLDSLFGVRQNSGWKPRGDGPSLSKIASGRQLVLFDGRLQVASPARHPWAPDVPAVIENASGKGRAVFLNLDLQNYGATRDSWPSGENYRALFHYLFSLAGVEAEVKASGAPRILVRRLSGRTADYIAILRNPADPKKSEGPARVHLVLPRMARVRDLRGGALGTLRELDINLDGVNPVILEISR